METFLDWIVARLAELPSLLVLAFLIGAPVGLLATAIRLLNRQDEDRDRRR